VGDEPSNLLEAVPVETDSEGSTLPRRFGHDGSRVPPAALAGLLVGVVMGLGIALIVASVREGDTSPVPHRVGSVVGPLTAQAFVALDVAALNGSRTTASLPWQSGRGDFLIHCEGGRRVVVADVWGLNPRFTYKWVMSDLQELSLDPAAARKPPIQLQILIGTGTMERLIPTSDDITYFRLVTRMVFAAPLDDLSKRPLLVVNGHAADPGLGWVVMAPNDAVELLRKGCA
jgi:hypothetical protein